MSQDKFDLDAARELYSMPHWQGGYFDINDKGQVCMRTPADHQHPGVDLYALTQVLQQQGMCLPVLVRFQDILSHRIDRLTHAFDRAIQEFAYQGSYTAVYPIKVNQQRSVVAQILSHGGMRVGLESGSKPELMAVLALSQPGGVIVCNGYKDREYLRIALIGRLLGQQIYIVIEKLSELEGIIEACRDLGVRPYLGVRVRLASIGKGKWQNTGGEKAKFGLSAAQCLTLITRLRNEGMLDCLQLLHFHMGSQIANIRDIHTGMVEAARYYAELHELGAPINVVDVGGGLGVDYEGTRSRSDCSINYTLQEYANNIVRTLQNVCVEENLPAPTIFTESGRAMTAHHAVLITNVIDTERTRVEAPLQPPDKDAPMILQDMWRLYTNHASMSPSEVYHDLAHWQNDAQMMFSHGVFDLAQRAFAEQLYFATCERLLNAEDTRLPIEIRSEIYDKLADKYFCNFSVFQSVPDVWAIDQIFPIMPLHRLHEKPQRRVVLQDLTCDSDGHIDRYVDASGIVNHLPLHTINPGEPYLIGIFLVGAYQEILGDLHNLFGDTHSVNVALDKDKGYRLVEAERGDGIDELLRYVHFDPAQLLQAYDDKVKRAGLDEQTSQSILDELKNGLSGYTYHEST